MLIYCISSLFDEVGLLSAVTFDTSKQVRGTLTIRRTLERFSSYEQSYDLLM